MRSMKSMFVVLKQKRTPEERNSFSVHLRARNQEAGEATVALCRELCPPGHEVRDASVKLIANLSGKGSNGKRRKVIVRFSQTDSGPALRVPDLRERFAPAWVVSRGEARVQPTSPSDAPTPDPRTSTRS